MARGIAAELEKLRRGGTFDEFERATRRDWARIAQYLFRRWTLPAGVEPEDLRQELLIASWQAAVAWDPARKVPLKNFVVWRSVTAAKHWIHKQRAAGKHGDHAPSRHAVSFTSLGVDDVPQTSEPTQFGAVAFRRGVSQFLEGANPEEQQCLLAVLDAGSVREAVDNLFGSGVYKRRKSATKAVTETLAQLEVSEWLQ